MQTINKNLWFYHLQIRSTKVDQDIDIQKPISLPCVQTTLMFVIVDHSSVLTVNVLVKLRCCYEKRKDEWSTRLFLSNLKIGHILVALFFDHHIIDLQSYHNLSCEPLQINYESNKQVYNLRHVLFISQILRYLHRIK